FAKATLPAQVVAASTQSSLATLPAMLESARERMGITRAVAGLVLPMAVTLFRITSPIQYVVAACFVAWAYGIELSALQLAAGAALAVVISLGSVGLPGQVSFMATVLPVTQSMGLPVEPLGLLLAVDTIPDVVATTGNVTGDLAAAGIVSRHSPDAADADAERQDAAAPRAAAAHAGVAARAPPAPAAGAGGPRGDAAAPVHPARPGHRAGRAGRRPRRRDRARLPVADRARGHRDGFGAGRPARGAHRHGSRGAARCRRRRRDRAGRGPGRGGGAAAGHHPGRRGADDRRRRRGRQLVVGADGR